MNFEILPLKHKFPKPPTFFFLLTLFQDNNEQLSFNDTMKAYFCYRHTLFKTKTLSRLFYLFYVLNILKLGSHLDL